MHKPDPQSHVKGGGPAAYTLACINHSPHPFALQASREVLGVPEQHNVFALVVVQADLQRGQGIREAINLRGVGVGWGWDFTCFAIVPGDSCCTCHRTCPCPAHLLDLAIHDSCGGKRRREGSDFTSAAKNGAGRARLAAVTSVCSPAALSAWRFAPNKLI